MTVEVKTCPRCGQQYKYVETRRIKEQTYYYALHIFRGEDGRKHVHKCYLGAETYIYVKTVHMDSKIQFHGYTYVNRYKEYARDLSDYLNRDKKHTTVKPRPKTEIDPFIKTLFAKAKWNITIVALNALYQKYLPHALELGVSLDQYNNLFETLDHKLTYSELEQYICMNLEGVNYARE